jgi:Zn-dependent protease with chaperone function
MKTIEAYRELIARTERLQATRPLWYQMRVAAIALFGIGYVMLVALLALILGLGMLVLLVSLHAAVLIKIAWIPIALAFVLLKAMWVRIPPPNGRPVKREQAPALFAEIEHVRAVLNAKPIHAVVLTAEFNAGVAQVPRLGILGWSRRYLVLGLPLMASLPLEQFRAVLAHEFGHLARNHGRFSNWIYRVRSTWYRLLNTLEAQRSFASGLFIRFFNWYAPYFEAYSFVLARANEYEADAHSARVAGKEHAGRALVSVYTRSSYATSDLWEAFYRPARDRADPPPEPFTCYLTELQSAGDASLKDALSAALARKTDVHDTHPCLTDRLAALGENAHAPDAPTSSAADVLLGPIARELAAEHDQAWRESIAKNWHERHRHYQEALESSEKFRTLALERTLLPKEQIEYAQSLELRSENAAALPLLESALTAEPANASALFLRGRIRLASGDDDGVADLARAMELEEQAIGAACELLYRYLVRRNELARFAPYETKYRDFEQKQALARAERNSVSPSDHYLAHELDDETVQQIAVAVRRHDTLEGAWLARKQLEHYPDRPLYVLVVEGNGVDPVSQKTLDSVAKALPETLSAFILNAAASPRIFEQVRSLPGAALL